MLFGGATGMLATAYGELMMGVGAAVIKVPCEEIGYTRMYLCMYV